jgi:hypothetical protein
MKRPRDKSAQHAIDAEDPQQQRTKRTASKILEGLRKAASNTERHGFQDLLLAYKETKHPILQTLEPQG